MKKKLDDNFEDDAPLDAEAEEAPVTNGEDSISSRQRAHAAKIAELSGGK
jgi:hypothetical protein